MGKEGPCFHCGIEYTPLWRHGPPDKPVLCNACGSRWRIRKTLDDYMPKHASASKIIGNTDNQSYQRGELPVEVKPDIPMRVDNCKMPNLGVDIAKFDHYSAGSEDDMKNGSSSGSAISLSESCIQMGSINAKDIPGSSQPAFWKPHVPTRKKSMRKQRVLSTVERLQRQLYNILQEPEFSMLSKNQDEDVLIYDHDKETQMSCAETALGAMLLRPPATAAAEKDTKANSSAVDQSEACCTSDPPVEFSS